MKIVVGILIVIGAFLARNIFRLKGKYIPLLTDEHFLEVAGAIPELKRAAFEEIGKPIESHDDPHATLTSAGLVLLYTVSLIPDRNQLLNQISMSFRGAQLAWSFAGRITYMICYLLGIETKEIVIAHSRNGVAHFAFLVPDQKRTEFEQRDIVKLSADEMGATKTDGGEFMSQALRDKRILPDEEELLPALLSAV